MAPLHWARLHVDVNCHLRRGAWYRVLRLLVRDVVLDVPGKPLTVPRSYLSLSLTPPSRWSVVSRPAAAPRLPSGWEVGYVVCPSCRERAPLNGHPLSMRCRRCNGLFDVAWGEQDMATA